jgi:hypothetical protein
MLTMQSGDDSLPKKTFGKPEPTEKLHQHQLVKFCLEIVNNCDSPDEMRNKASKLVAEWRKLQMLSRTSPKQQQAKAEKLQALIDRMEKFRRENQ